MKKLKSTLYHYHFHRIFCCFFLTGTFFNSTTLEELYLDGSSLPLNFLHNIGVLHALKVLSAGECDLNGTLSTQGKLATLHLPIIT
jgi:hypothetical protein